MKKISDANSWCHMQIMSNNWIFMHISWSVVYSFIVNFGSIALLFFFLEREYIRSSRYLNSFQDNTVCRLMCGWKAEKKSCVCVFPIWFFYIPSHHFHYYIVVLFFGLDTYSHLVLSVWYRHDSFKSSFIYCRSHGFAFPYPFERYHIYSNNISITTTTTTRNTRNQMRKA